MIRPVVFIALLILRICQGGIASGQEAVQVFGADTAATVLRLRTTTDIEIFAPTVQDFISLYPNYAVRYEQWGSNDLFDLTANECIDLGPQADIVISSGVHQMVKLVNDRCADQWMSPATNSISPELMWRNEIWGITREPAVMVYNKRLVSPADVPKTRFDVLDLLRPQGTPFAGKIATYDIEASGLGFLFAFMDSQEASTFGALMEAFARTGAVATCCSSEIINGVIEGRYLIAYNVLGSYANTIAKDQPILGIVEPQDYTLVLSRAAILPRQKAGPQKAATDFLDYLLGPRGQAKMSANFLVSRPQPTLSGAGSSTWRSIGLGPSLLVAKDKATVARFKNRWKDIFSDFTQNN